MTTDDIQIFPLKDGLIDGPSDTIQLSDYDMDHPVSKDVYESILRPFEFRGKKHPILITEFEIHSCGR